ncbi:LysR family transcriptional regulator [Achromobacter insolitus]|uniref:LysR family transcriptional regulator n=1 Tax=Achromobacter insolitus TaxID=217204 RepID=UPI000DD16192|nr:LysR family transcriptional regulator [Achromobacter insolitus]AXA70464.1 LysR family transcriptional regulator [Achromobacter insolitus]
MNLRQIEAFLAVVDLGTVTRAAESMYVTQSAVSRLLARLEREVGFQLFDRRQGVMVPTVEARALHVEAMRSYIGLKDIQLAAQRIAQIGSGTLKICVMNSLQQGALPKLVTAFMREHPGITVMFDVQRHYDVVYAVSRGSAEIGFATLPVDHPDIESLPIARTPAVCLLPAGHPLAELETIGPMDLQGVDFINVPRKRFNDRITRVHDRITRILDAHGVRPRMRIEAGTMLAAMALVEAGAGAFVVDAFTLGAVRDANVVIRPFHPEVIVEVGALYSSSQPLSILASKFLNYCRAFQQQTETT